MLMTHTSYVYFPTKTTSCGHSHQNAKHWPESQNS